MARFGLIATTTALFAAVGVAPAQANFSTCTYDAATKVVTATLAANAFGRIGKDSGVIIRADDNACGAATISNTDTIRLGGGSGREAVTIDLRQGTLEPGATDEPGGSDEIEIELQPGAAPIERVQVLGSSGPDSVVVSREADQTLFNLNAREVDGVDADLTLPGQVLQELVGGDGDDLLHGTLDLNPVRISNLQVQGGAGNDDLTGGDLRPGPGNDVLHFGGSGVIVSFPSATTSVSIFTQLAAPGQPGGGTLPGRDGYGTTDTYTGAGAEFIGTAAGDVFTGGDGPDVMLALGGNDVIDGGGGNDRLFGNEGNDELRGGSGNDELDGEDGNDLMLGGDGADRIRGGLGNDDQQGGDGDDAFLEIASAVAATDGADVMAGGPGVDRAEYETYLCFEPNNFGFQLGFRRAGVTADLDGEADDGAPGEGDRIGTDVETIGGTVFDDKLTGNGESNLLIGYGGDDVLRGGGGADRLEGNGVPCAGTFTPDGKDDLDGEAGADVVNADIGDDRIGAADGVADVVDCGPGIDTAALDAVDAATGCETAPAPPAPDPTTTPTPLPGPPAPDPVPTPAQPMVVAPPAPKPPPVPTVPSVSSLLERPAAAKCVSRRSLRLRVKRGVVGRVRSIVVFVGSKRKTSISGRRLRLPVDLRGLPRGRFAVRLVITLVDGSTTTDTRRYRTCTAKRTRPR